eukprot:scaffold265394_cov30-Tisochrysis_lutea.AAC.1
MPKVGQAMQPRAGRPAATTGERARPSLADYRAGTWHRARAPRFRFAQLQPLRRSPHPTSTLATPWPALQTCSIPARLHQRLHGSERAPLPVSHSTMGAEPTRVRICNCQAGRASTCTTRPWPVARGGRGVRPRQVDSSQTGHYKIQKPMHEHRALVHVERAGAKDWAQATKGDRAT